MTDGKRCTILGIPFFAGTAPEAVQEGLKGGLVVVPAAPALAAMLKDPAYLDALLHADLVLPDSGLMVLYWRLLRRAKLDRVSGLEYLALMLKLDSVREKGASFWVMPSAAAADRNRAWLLKQGIEVGASHCYVAPQYAGGELEDEELLRQVKDSGAKQVFVCLGGGVQERLGRYLQRSEPGLAIHCIGAAIGFLSGDQVRIPMWADAIYAGWLFRCLSDPRRFVPRYVAAIHLVSMLWKYGERLPDDCAAAQ